MHNRISNRFIPTSQFVSIEDILCGLFNLNILTAITLAIHIAKVILIAVNFTEIFRNICSVIDNHIEFSSLPFDIIENYVYK